jgi:hypothetical protein
MLWPQHLNQIRDTVGLGLVPKAKGYFKMADFFQFETDFVDSLRCIPMQVRYRLDTCGVKLKLHQWNLFTLVDRTKLVDFDPQNDLEIDRYRDLVVQLIQERSGEEATLLSIAPQPPWLNEAEIPTVLAEKISAAEINFSLSRWQELTVLQRFALIKLSGASHEQNNFLPALREFKVI